MGSGDSSAGGVREWGLEARGLRREVEECLNFFFLCFLDLPNFNDLDLDDEHPLERLCDQPWDLPRDLARDQE